MISRNRDFVHLAACTATCLALWIVLSAPFVAAQSSWQAEWEKTLRAAEAEGQFALYGCCYDYDRVLEVFRKRYPKIKANIVVAVADIQVGQRGSAAKVMTASARFCQLQAGGNQRSDCF